MSQQYPQQPPSQAPEGGYPPPVQGPPPGWQPPKQRKPFVKRTWVLVVASVFAILVVIGAVNGGSKTASISESTKTGTPKAAPTTGKASTVAPSAKAPVAPPTQADAKCAGNRNDPCTVKLGVAFTIGKHQLGKGWKLKADQYLGTSLVGTVTNVSTEPSTAFFTVKFLKGTKVVANFQCSSNGLEPQQDEDISCFNTSDTSRSVTKGSYDTITAEADF